MLTLYYWPGASSVIPHITLEEIGTPYQRKLVNLAQGEHKGDAYLKINPHGKVPALAIDDKVLTENVAILTYLAKQFPDAQLLPHDLAEEVRCISTMAWFASAVHPTFAHIIRPERFASDAATHGNMKEPACTTFCAFCSAPRFQGCAHLRKPASQARTRGMGATIPRCTSVKGLDRQIRACGAS